MTYDEKSQRICPRCSRPVRKNAVFCGHCGLDLNAPESSALPPVPGMQLPEQGVQPEQPICPTCGKVVRAGAKFCSACGNPIIIEEAKPVPEQPVPVVDQEPAADGSQIIPENPVEMPVSAMADLSEDQESPIELDQHLEEETVQPAPKATNPAKVQLGWKIAAGVLMLGGLIVLGIIFGSQWFAMDEALPQQTATIEMTPIFTTEPTTITEPTAVPTVEPTLPAPTNTAIPDPIKIGMDFNEDKLSAEWVKAGSMGAVVEVLNQAQDGVLRVNSDIGKGYVSYSPPLVAGKGLTIQMLVYASAPMNLTLFDSETLVAVGASPMLTLQLGAEPAVLTLTRADNVEVSLPLPKLDWQQSHTVKVIIQSDGMVSILIDGNQVATSGKDLMMITVESNLRLAFTGSGWIDDLIISYPQ